MPRLVATSDVTRFRGVCIAALVAAGVAVAIVLLRSPAASRGGAPGPLSASHRKAGIACGTCHTQGTREPPPSRACAGCHGAHPSTRAGHAELRKARAMTCASCHGGHQGHGAVTFFPDGRALRTDPAGARALAAGAFRPPRAVTVPLVEARACARCHDPAAAPLSSCAIGGVTGVAGCFDEHTPVRDAKGTIAGRDLAWEAAREVARELPPRPAPAGGDTAAPGWWLAAAGIVAGLSAWIVRRVARARAAPRRSRSGGVRETAGREAGAPIDGRMGGADVRATDGGAERRDADGFAPLADGGAGPRDGIAANKAVRRLPVIDAKTCLGCDACVEACPYDVLEVKRYVAVVARPDACCGLTLCAQVCPNQSLTMQDVELEGAAASRPIARNQLESADQPGLYLVGDAGGGSLIRNAVDEGAAAVAAIAAGLGKRPRDADLLDVVIIGAGPAGLAAALEAQARGLRALTLEQGSVAGSIQSFPRGKLVLDHAAADTPAPRLWLAEATKEELLARWMLALRTARPPIREGRRVVGVTAEPDGTWTVESIGASPPASVETPDAAGGERHRARKVVLAIGRRGSPRTLPIDIPPDMAAHVHYALADAASFAGQRVIVVGLGDVAMEAAIALSRQPGTRVTIAHRSEGFRRGRARNLDELRRRIAAGAVHLHERTEIAALHAGRATLRTPTGLVDEPCDALFVLIGAEPGGELLARLTTPVQLAQTDAGHHALAPVGPVQDPGDRGEEAPP